MTKLTDTAGPSPSRAASPPPSAPLAIATGATVAALAPAPVPNKTIWLAFFHGHKGWRA